MSLETMKIELLGASFTIQTDESRDYMEKILAQLRKTADSVRASSGVSEPLVLSILTSVYIVDELFRERARASSDPEAEEALLKAATRLVESISAEPSIKAQAHPGPMARESGVHA